ncbi:MAG TPA: glycosyltransferase [Actinoplanes sp.]|nr:glycosyltransferase [Actinoplanes sp.]
MSVVIPALNEEHNIPLVLEGLPPVDEVIVVDGGSDDDTIAVVREIRPDAVIIRQTRTGKGNALVCGFAASRGDIVVTVNADGSTDPGELPRFVDALLSGAEVAHGSRFRDGGGQLDGRRLDRLGNRMFSQVVNLFFGTRFTDLGYGYNAYWRALLPSLDLPDPEVRSLRRRERLWGDGPEIEPMINIRMAAHGLRVVEVASVGYPPIHGTRDRNSLSRAQRAVHAAMAEYVRRWRMGRGAGEPAARPAVSRPAGTRSAAADSAAAQSMADRSGAGRPRSTAGWPPEARSVRARRTGARAAETWPPQVPPAEAQPTRARAGEAWPPQVPPAETQPTRARAAEAWLPQVPPAEARPTRARAAEAWPPQAPPTEAAETWPVETPSVRARREPGSGRRPDAQATARHGTPAAPRRRRDAEAAPETWPEDEESTGRHSADADGRRAPLTAADRRRGYPEPVQDPTPAEPLPSQPTRRRGRVEPGQDHITTGERPSQSYETPRRHGYTEPDRGSDAAEGYPGEPRRRRGYAEPDPARPTAAAEYPEPERGEPRGRRSYPEPSREPRTPADDYSQPERSKSRGRRSYPEPDAALPAAADEYPSKSGRRRGYPEPNPARPTAADEYPSKSRRRRSYPEPDPASPIADEYPGPERSKSRGRRGYPEPGAAGSTAADEYPGPERGESRARRGYPEPGREPSVEGRAAERGREGRAAERGREGRERTWRIPDEPWRGTEEPWRGPDGEYHTGQFQAVTDDDPPPQPSAARPDLTIISGDTEYESDYEGRDTPLPRPGTAAQGRRDGTPRSREAT